MEEAAELYDPEQHEFLTMLGYGDLHNLNLSYYEFVICFMGYLGQSISLNKQVIVRAEALDHLQTRWAAYCNSCIMYSSRREWDKLLDLVNMAYPLALEKQERFIITLLKFFYGYAHAFHGQPEMIMLSYEAIDEMEAIGNLVTMLSEVIFLAEHQINKRKFDKSDELLIRAEAILDRWRTITG